MSNVNDSTAFIPVYKSSFLLHKAILKNDLESLKHILSDGRRDSLNDLDHSGRTPFHVALQTANPKALYLMLYYPLLHPSKVFATLDWTNYLDSTTLPESYEAYEEWVDKLTENSTNQSSSPTSAANNSTLNSKGNKPKSSEGTEQNKSSSLGKRLLSHWKSNPSEYLNTCLSLDERNHVHGCGLKEVESLYEEHYKFLIGESHELENAARNYTNRFVRLYYFSLYKKNFRDYSLVKPETGSPRKTKTDSPGDNQSDSPEKGDPENKDKGSPTSLNTDDQVKEKLAEKMSSEAVERLSKGLLQLETVDLISTFDKTAPIHLLFSNVYISTYRSNMLKCFRILIYYFNKSKEFHSLYKSLDYVLYFNSYSLNKCLKMYWDHKNKEKETKNKEKVVGNKVKISSERNLRNTLKRTNPKETTESNEEELEEPNKRELKEDLSSTKRVKTSESESRASKVPNYPNNTLVADATEISLNGDNRSKTLLNSEEVGKKENLENRNNLFQEWDEKSFSLHQLMANTIKWVQPQVTWEKFVRNPDFSRSTVLHRVCNLKDQNLIKLVLSCGFSPLVVNEAGDMPVHLTINSKDPEGFLTILHATLKALFYSRFEEKNKCEPTETPVEMEGLDQVEEKQESSDEKYTNELYNMYMGYLCHEFFKNGENLDGSFYKNIKSHKFKELKETLDPVNRRVLFDEFLMLYEQLVYRCIKCSAWDCLIGLMAYNSAITYHMLSNPCFMHRFVNYSCMNNSSGEFLNVTDFVMTNLLFEKQNSERVVNSPKTLNIVKKRGVSPNSGLFKGCGIPHSGLRSLTVTNGYKSVANYNLPCFNEDPVLCKFIKSYKVSAKCNQNQLKTWIITHPTCLHHLATPEPTDAPNKRHRLIVTYPENPTRLEVIISNDNGILRSDTLDNVKLIHSPPPASLADILRVHDCAYVDKLLEQVQVAQKRWATNPYWPVLADGDTPVTPHSWSAALYAAGSVITAVDAVCNNQCKNAFCAVRPPGHHLGTWGAAQNNNFEDEDFAAGSQGFCLINNVAIGAAYAKYTYEQKGIKRIAIVDFDVHHGNGTEQVVRNIGMKNVKVKVNPVEGPYPGMQSQTQTIVKKWFGWRNEKDRDEVLFCSIHAYDGVFYPGTGQQCTLYQKENKPNIINVAVPQGTSSPEFRALFETKICPYVYHFKPDLIFISAGFDGHYRDSVSYGFTRYTEKDFNYVTERLVTIANTVCQGRVVSVLEGGYNTKLNTLSPFARSVLEHVTALCNTNENTTYPNMYGENSITYLLTPVVKSVTEVKESELNLLPTTVTPSKTNANMNLNPGTGNTSTQTENPSSSSSSSPTITPTSKDSDYEDYLNQKINTQLMNKANKFKSDTEELIKKVYSKVKGYCKQERLEKYDKTQMCCKSVLEMNGNTFYSFYSRYFYTLFSVMTTNMDLEGFKLKEMNGLPLVELKEVESDSDTSKDLENSNSENEAEDSTREEMVEMGETKADFQPGKRSRSTSPKMEPTASPPMRPSLNHSNLNGLNSSSLPNENHLENQVSEPSQPGVSLSLSQSSGLTDLSSSFVTLTSEEKSSQNVAPLKENTDQMTNGMMLKIVDHDKSDSQELNRSLNRINEKLKEEVGVDMEGEIDEVAMKLRTANELSQCVRQVTSNPWLGESRLSALEQNYKVAVRLEAFYTKYSELFNKTCHIHN